MSEGLIINPGFFVYYATITVTYPSGSTLTCTCGSDSFTAETTSGSYTFVVPYAGTWVVKATKGSQSKSANISVTTYNQAASVTLSYEYYIFKSGSGIENGLTIKHGGAGWVSTAQADLPTSPPGACILNTTSLSALSTDAGRSYFVASPIDLTGYSTLYLDIKCNGRYDDSRRVTFGVGTDALTNYYTAGSWAASKSIYNTTRATQSVDIASLTGSYYVKIMGFAVTHEIYNWWLA